MPLYEYDCEDCQKLSEVLIRGNESPVCEHCGGTHLKKLFSVTAAPRGSETAGSPMPMAGPCGRMECGMGGCQGLG